MYILNRIAQGLRTFLSNTRGSIATVFIGLAVGLLVLAYTLPMAINALFTANTTGWSTDAIAIWDILPVMAILGAFIIIVAYAVSKKMG